MSAQQKAETKAELTDEELEALKAARFRERVNRVLAAMRREGVDWQAVLHITPDGRIGARVMPVEMRER